MLFMKDSDSLRLILIPLQTVLILSEIKNRIGCLGYKEYFIILDFLAGAEWGETPSVATIAP